MEVDIRIPNEDGSHGKYDDDCVALTRALGAQGVALVVMSGYKGTGFSISMRDPILLNPRLLNSLADMFEHVAADFRRKAG